MPAAVTPPSEAEGEPVHSNTVGVNSIQHIDATNTEGSMPATAAAAVRPSAPPRRSFARESTGRSGVRELCEMGFNSPQANEALAAAGGDRVLAAQLLFGEVPEPSIIAHSIAAGRQRRRHEERPVPSTQAAKPTAKTKPGRKPVKLAAGQRVSASSEIFGDRYYNAATLGPHWRANRDHGAVVHQQGKGLQLTLIHLARVFCL